MQRCNLFTSLLLLTLFFGLLTFLTHYFLNGQLSSISIFSSILHSSQLSTQQCSEQMMGERMELSDLRRIKASFLAEMKQTQARRTRLLRLTDRLRSQINGYSRDIAALRQLHSHLKLEMAQYLKSISRLETHLNRQFQLTSNWTLPLHFTSFLPIEQKKERPVGYSMERCFDLSRCPTGEGLKVLLHADATIFSHLDFTQLNQSIHLVRNVEDACIVAIITNGDMETWFNLGSVLLNVKSSQNLLIIDLTAVTSSISNKTARILSGKSFDALSNSQHHTLSDHLARASYATFTYPKYENSEMLIHFSMLSAEFQVNDIPLTTEYNTIRKHLLSYHHTHSGIDNLSIWAQQQSQNHLNFNLNCTGDSVADLCGTFPDRSNWLHSSTFVLIVSNSDFLFTHEMARRLLEALATSTVPVILGMDTRLPLNHLISWDEVVVKVPSAHLPQLIPLLSRISPTDISNRQRKARNIFNSYFRSSTKQLQTVFAAIQHRLHLPAPHSSAVHVETEKLYPQAQSKDYASDGQNGDYYGDTMEYLGRRNQPALASSTFTVSVYTAWNVLYHPFNSFPSTPFDSNPPTQFEKWNSAKNRTHEEERLLREYSSLRNHTIGGGDGKLFAYSLGGNYADEQFTVVIMSFERELLLAASLETYVKLPYLHSIVVIWNSVEMKPSRAFKKRFSGYLASHRIQLAYPGRNSLNNRFLPLHLIQTDAILSIDDDIFLRSDEIMLAFRVWRENRGRIVGFPARYHAWNETSSRFVYQSALSCEYSLILTGAAFYHRFYQHAYTHIMDVRIRERVDALTNCEDIAMNMLVSHLTRQAPLKVTAKWTFSCSECEANGTAVSSRVGHYEERSECIQYFIKIYGYNPLLYSQFRADSVLFKTRIPEDKQKCFKLV